MTTAIKASTTLDDTLVMPYGSTDEIANIFNLKVFNVSHFAVHFRPKALGTGLISVTGNMTTKPSFKVLSKDKVYVKIETMFVGERIEQPLSKPKAESEGSRQGHIAFTSHDTTKGDSLALKPIDTSNLNAISEFGCLHSIKHLSVRIKSAKTFNFAQQKRLAPLTNEGELCQTTYKNVETFLRDARVAADAALHHIYLRLEHTNMKFEEVIEEMGLLDCVWEVEAKHNLMRLLRHNYTTYLFLITKEKQKLGRTPEIEERLACVQPQDGDFEKLSTVFSKNGDFFVNTVQFETVTSKPKGSKQTLKLKLSKEELAAYSKKTTKYSTGVIGENNQTLNEVVSYTEEKKINSELYDISSQREEPSGYTLDKKKLANFAELFTECLSLETTQGENKAFELAENQKNSAILEFIGGIKNPHNANVKDLLADLTSTGMDDN